MAKRSRTSRKPGGASWLAEFTRAFREGDYKGAQDLARPIAERRPNDVQALHAVAVCDLHMGRIEQAAERLERVVKMRPDLAGPHAELGTALQILGRFDEARAVVERALTLDPKSTHAASVKMELLLLLGAHEEASRFIAPFEEAGIEAPELAVVLARLCLKQDDPERAIPALRAVLEREIPAGARLTVNFALGDCLEHAGRYDEAFRAYESGNAQARVTFSPAAHEANVEALIRAWTPEAVRRLAPPELAEADAALPVFVVGMPRSGTTLVEQILDTLPGVAGLGELEAVPRIVYRLSSVLGVGDVNTLHAPSVLTSYSLKNSAQEYLGVVRPRAGDASRAIDKMPINFLHLGLIAAMFPRAKVIHCVRDPMATCFSCFQQNFGSGLQWHRDLRHIGVFYRSYRRLMEHWGSVLDLEMTECAYETMVGETEAEAKRLAAFIGAEWSDGALRFHESGRVAVTASNQQVRRPVYRSALEKWKHYDAHLGPLREALEGR